MNSLGIVVNIDDEEIQVYRKGTKGFVVETVKKTEENSNLEIGNIVEMNENGIRRAELAQYKLLIRKAGKLKFSIENIFVYLEHNPKEGLFVNDLFGFVDDSGKMLDFAAYASIEITEHPKKTKEFFWKVTHCRKVGEKYRDGDGDEEADNAVDRLTNRYANYPELLIAEAKKNEEQENALYKKIGKCEIVDFDNTNVIIGKVPILKPVVHIPHDTMHRLSDGANVCMKRLEGDENKDVMDLPIGIISVQNKMIHIRLSKETREHVNNFNIGDQFTLESVQIETNIDYWITKKHGKNLLLLETLEDCETIRNRALVKEANSAPLPSDSSDDEDFKKKNEDLKKHHLKKRAQREATAKDTPLNDDQKEAVRLALELDNKFVMIQGPPGTGKSHTLADIVCEMISRKQQVLVVTPTRFARDNIQKIVRKRMEERKMKMHETTLMDQEKHELLLLDHELYENIKKLVTERDKNPTDRNKVNELDKTISELKNRASQDILRKTMVVFSTITSAFVDISRRKTNFKPKTLILDEAGQLCEAHFWPKANGMKRVVLAGDPKQLSATVLSEEGRNKNLNVSLMERLFEENKKIHFVLLRTQYRMNSKIMGWSSRVFYDSKLEADPSVDKIDISSIPKMKPNFAKRIIEDIRFGALTVCDTGAEKDQNLFPSYFEGYDKAGSYLNFGEAQLIAKHVFNLIQRSVPPTSIAVITPYNGQKTLILGLLKTIFNDKVKVDVDTVDAFQGQERDIILFSLVRNNPVVSLGFINETRRLNVAITRAKRQFFMVGSLWMLKNSQNRELFSLFDFIKTEAVIVTPQMIRNEQDYTPKTVEHLFGKYFDLFIEYCKDGELKARCEDKAYICKANEKVNKFRMGRRFKNEQN